MAVSISETPGFSRVLEEYAEELCDINGALTSNIEACRRLAFLCKQTYGPSLRSKIVINNVDILSFAIINDENENYEAEFVDSSSDSSDSEDDTENDNNGTMSGNSDDENKSDTLEIVEEKRKPAPVESRISTRERNKEDYINKINHPATKILALAAVMQRQEAGDGANFVMILAAELLAQAGGLLILTEDLTPDDLCNGFRIAFRKTHEFLHNLRCHEIRDIRSKYLQPIISKAVKSSIMTKQYGQAHFITDLVLKACYSTLLENSTFNVDNVKVCKILGSNVYDSTVVVGMVFERINEGYITRQTNAKIAVYTCPIDITTNETKGTVLINPSEELQSFHCGKEMVLEKQIKGISDAGVTVIVASGKFGDRALHYLNKYKIMVVQLRSEEDLRRLCTSVTATSLPRLTPPNKEELGYADCVYVDDLGDTSLVVFRLDGEDSRMSTIVIRGSTDNYMDDIERAIDDGVNTFKNLTRDGRFLPGAGATEMELAYQLGLYADNLSPYMKQKLVVNGFASALKAIVATLAEKAGVNSKQFLADLYIQHREGRNNAGLYIEVPTGSTIIDVRKVGIVDSYLVKFWGLHYATDAACTILKIDKIIMAKRAEEERRAHDNDDDDDDENDDHDHDHERLHNATDNACTILKINKIIMAKRAEQKRRARDNGDDDENDENEDDDDHENDNVDKDDDVFL